MVVVGLVVKEVEVVLGCVSGSEGGGGRCGGSGGVGSEGGMEVVLVIV